MTNTSSKANSAYSEIYPGSDRHDGSDRFGAGFDLRETLGDTKVREATFAEFLAELKKANKQAG
jgi:hypothetical protein